MRAILAGACAALALAGAIGCSAVESPGEESGGERAVYVSLPTSGRTAEQGRAIRRGAQLAPRYESAEGGLPDLGLRFRDDARGPRWSAAAVGDNARLATSDSSSVAYIGELESGATRVSVPITNEARLLQVSPASTALDLVSPFPGSDEVPELVQPTGERTFGRVIPDDGVQAAAGAVWAKRLGARSAVAITDGSQFGDLVAREFAERAGELGVATERPVPVASARRAVRANPDVVYYGGTATRALPLLERVSRRAPAAIVMATDALLHDASFLGRSRGFESRLRLTSSAQDPSQLPAPRGQRFVRRYIAEYGSRPTPYAAYGYEAMAVVLDAIRRAGGDADRTGVVTAFFDTRDRESILGTYSIDELGDTTLDRIAGYRVRDGRPLFAAALRAS